MGNKIRHKYLESLDLNELQIHGKLEKEDLEEIFSNNFESIWVPHEDVSILGTITKELNHVKAIRYCPYENQDISWINELPNLEYLYLEGPMKGVIDFNNFKKIKELDIEFCRTTKSILTSSIKPKILGLSKFKGPLESLPHSLFESVNSLLLASSSVGNLDGLSKFSNISSLTLERNLKLTNIDGLAFHPELKEFYISGSNKISDYSVLSLLTSLEEFYFMNKSIPSLKLLKSDKLKFVELGDSTTVEDMDIKALLEIPSMRRAIFSKRKGYSMGAVEMKEILDKRNNC
ncbi:hypothetical protein OE749_12465 [Aestuariibacter sp. AA17]|uniref:Leucine-rich repeat domain-containing protein n=1 Tax=Fluctibacter corallii TaxID=2984329 RepID=A0ABT3AA01_9ALTE|nr:hypothetical protein [Aestuariibacter sp. AA17]MCV2885509.1 hypothetical protein [Aestuariibacter sp. AA17]